MPWTNERMTPKKRQRRSNTEEQVPCQAHHTDVSNRPEDSQIFRSFRKGLGTVDESDKAEGKAAERALGKADAKA